MGGWGELHSPLIDPSDFSTLSGEGGMSPIHGRHHHGEDGSDSGVGGGGRGGKRIDSPNHSNNTSAFLSANQNVLQSILSNNSFAPRQSNNSLRSSQRSSTRSATTHPNAHAHTYPPHDEEDSYSEHTDDYTGEGGGGGGGGGAGGYDDSLSYSIGAGYGGGYGGGVDTPDSSMLHHLMHMTSTPHSQSKTLARIKVGEAGVGGGGGGRGSEESERSTGEVGGAGGAGGLMMMGGDGMGEESIRATTTTLPSDLYFPNIIRQAGGVEDFSYRGGDMHNGHYN